MKTFEYLLTSQNVKVLDPRYSLRQYIFGKLSNWLLHVAIFFVIQNSLSTRDIKRKLNGPWIEILYEGNHKSLMQLNVLNYQSLCSAIEAAKPFFSVAQNTAGATWQDHEMQKESMAMTGFHAWEGTRLERAELGRKQRFHFFFRNFRDSKIFPFWSKRSDVNFFLVRLKKRYIFCSQPQHHTLMPCTEFLKVGLL